MQVLNHDDQRTAATVAKMHLAQHPEGAHLDGLGAEPTEDIGLLFQAEQVQEIRCEVGAIHTELGELRAHFGGDDFRRVRVAQSALGPHEIEHGRVGNGTAEREASSFEVPGVPRAERAAELEEHPRLADAGLAYHSHRLSPTRFDFGQQILEQAQLAFATHERAQRPLAGRFER